jgi:hypothetical protein
VDGPPLDADDWSEDQWQEWLNHADNQADEPDAVVRTRPRSAGSAMLAAGMLGLERALYGKSPKPEIVIEAEADGHDDGTVVLDLDDPAGSRISVTRRHQPPEPT